MRVPLGSQVGGLPLVTGGGYVGPTERQALRDAGTGFILLIGRGESMVVDVHVLEAAYVDYAIVRDGLLLGGRNPEPEERAMGVGWVLEIDYAERGGPE